MNNAPDRVPADELERRRHEIRRGLFRVNTAVLVIITVVLGLAIGGILAAYHAAERAEQARNASEQARSELWKSYLAQATAERLSAVMGRKRAAQETITAAARIRPSLQLRNEAIANLALMDLTEISRQNLADDVTGFALDLVSNRVAFVSTYGQIRLFSPTEREPIWTFKGRGKRIEFLTFSPDSRFLLAREEGKSFYVLDALQGQLLFDGPVFRPFCFGANGQLLALLDSPKTIRLLQTSTGRDAREPVELPDPAQDVAFSPEGDRLLVNMGQQLQIRTLEGKLLQTLNTDLDIITMSWVGRQIAVGEEEGGIRVWDLQSRRSKEWAAHRMVVDFVVFNHAGTVLASSSFDGSCRLWNPRTGELLLETTRGFPVGFSADDSRLAFCARSTFRNAWGWWQVARSDVFNVLDVSDGTSPNVYQVDFSPDGHFLAVTKNETTKLVEVSSGRSVALLSMSRARAAYFLPDGRSLVTCGDNRLSLWPLECNGAPDGKLKLGAARHIPLPQTAHVDSPIMDIGRTRIALPVSDTTAVLYRLDNLDHSVVFSNGDIPKNPCISPDGKWVVTGTFHGAGSTVWDGGSGKKLRDLDTGNSNPVFSPDGKMVVIAGDKEYRVYETGTWKLLRQIPTGSPSDLPACAAFSRDGGMLAIVKQRRLVQLIAPATWAVLGELTGPETQIINCLTFSWDGSVLAIGTPGDAVHLWKLKELQRQLAAAGLGWTATPDPARANAVAEASVLTPGSYRFMMAASAGVAMVVFCAWFVLRRQRHLFRAYLDSDTLIEQRNRELELAKTELMHSQKMKALGTLAAGIAHDFNNLLSVIRMSNKLIERETRGHPEVNENVTEVEHAVQQGKNLVRSMLGYSRQDTETGRVNLSEVVEDTVGLLSRQFLSGITLDLQLDRNSPPLNYSRARLEQILLNLIVNASEAMDGAGVLRIAVRTTATPGSCSILAPKSASRYVELVVADSGKGIDPGIAHRIFEPFFTTKPRGEKSGTGLGLSMVHNMAEQDGLGISLESNPGKGAAFRIVIPVEQIES